MRALVSDGHGGVTVQETADPGPGMSELVVRVYAVSVGPRDLRMAGAKPGLRLGSDFAGVVEQAAGRAGPQPGDRVAGVIPAGAWAERIAVSAGSVCRLPDAIGFADAAAAAATGLTALYSLERGMALVGSRVLVTGGGGAVGRLACQLAAVSGASALAWVRSPEAAASLAAIGVASAQGPSLASAVPSDSFALIVDLVGGEALADALKLLASGGMIVSVGAASGGSSLVDAAALYQKGHRIVGFGLFPELEAKPAGAGLARLLPLLADGRITAPATIMRSAFSSGLHLAAARGRRIVLDFT